MTVPPAAIPRLRTRSTTFPGVACQQSSDTKAEIYFLGLALKYGEISSRNCFGAIISAFDQALLASSAL